MPAFKHGELLTKRQVLRQQASAGAEDARECPEPEPEQVNHDGKVIADGILIPAPMLLISKPDGIVASHNLLHQIFNSSEKRLARTLLMLAHFSKKSRSEAIVPSINQENLAKMVGTTRSRISSFMNKFKKHGFVDYNGEMELTVNDSLLSVLLND
jgi:hypothetical protein